MKHQFAEGRPVDRETVADEMKIRDVVRDVVAEVASDELPVVAGLAELDEAAALRRMARSRPRRDPLAFGPDDVVPLVTPVVWLTLTEVARQLGDDAAGGVVAWVKTAARKALRRRAAPAVVPPLSREQIALVRQLVLEMATQRGLSERRAATIADAVTARLALDTPGSEVSPDGAPGGSSDRSDA